MKKLILVLISLILFLSCSRSKNLESESRLLYDRNEYNKALSVLEKHLERNFKDTSAYYLGYLIEKKRNHHFKALEYLNKTISLDSLNTNHYLNRIDLYNNLSGKHDFVLKDLDKLIEIDSSNKFRYLNEKSIVFFNQGKYDNTIILAKESYAIEENYTSLVLIAGSYFATNKYKEGLLWANRMVEFDKDVGEGYYFRGMANKVLGRYSKSCKDLAKSINLGYKIAEEEYSGYCSPPENSVGFQATLFLSDFSCKISKWETRKEASGGNYNLLDIYLVFHNRSYERKRIDLGEFKVSDSNGVLYSREFFDTKENNLSEVNLLPDGVVKGWVSYKIPKDSKVNLKYIPFAMDDEVIYTMYLNKIFFSEVQ